MAGKYRWCMIFLASADSQVLTNSIAQRTKGRN
jgi:hypothetical protein